MYKRQDYDRHRYDGKNWTYVNLPIEDIKEMAISSLKDSTMMYFSCDVGKFLNSDRGLLDVKNYDYESLMGTSFGMNKKQRIQSFASGSSHAMTLMAVDLDKNGKPTKWMVENSWGPAAGYQGYLIMTDDWFNEYMFRLVVETKYASKKALEVLKQKPDVYKRQRNVLSRSSISNKIAMIIKKLPTQAAITICLRLVELDPIG